MVDAAAESAVDSALSLLARERNYTLEWPTCELALLTSLAGAVAARVPQVVARCRQEGLSWTEIGDLVGTTKQSARSRFSATPGPRDPLRARGTA